MKVYTDQAQDALQLVQPSFANPSVISQPVVEDKYEKHKQNSDPILSNLLTPYEAFKGGFEKAIASYIKLGTEKEVKNKVVSQVQPKSEETQLLEDLIKRLLRNFDSVKFVKKDQEYLAISKGKLYQFSTLLKRVDFNQIELSSSELNSYHKLLNSGRLFAQPSLNGTRPTAQDFNNADPEKICQNLSLAEKEAINIYTGGSYQAMNNLMRGNITQAIESQYLPGMFTLKEKANHGIKEMLLHVAVAVSGLNKLPDYIPPVGEDGKPFKYLYRAEGYLPDDVLAKRKWAVLSGGGITTEMGFMSTAYLKPAEGFFGEHVKAGVMIKSLKGKKVTPLSQFGDGEREILLPPTQMQWRYHKEIITDIFKNHLSLFIAKPVTVAPEMTIDYIPRAKEQLVKSMNSEEKNAFNLKKAVA